MVTLSLMHWLLIGNFAMFVVLAGLLISVRRRQVRESARLDMAMHAIEQAQTALTKSTVGMGRRLKLLDTRVNDAERRVSTSPDDTLAQASRLVNLGATAKELVDNCGVPRGEAELLVSLKQRQATTPAAH